MFSLLNPDNYTEIVFVFCVITVPAMAVVWTLATVV